MEKVAPGTAYLPKVAVNIADLNRGQFKRGEAAVLCWNYPTQRERGYSGGNIQKCSGEPTGEATLPFTALIHRENPRVARVLVNTADRTYLPDFFAAFSCSRTSLLF